MGGSESRLGFCNDDRNKKQAVSTLPKNIIKRHEITLNQRGRRLWVMALQRLFAEAKRESWRQLQSNE
jgi:hypothetical protein